jgi:hypothetical protein
MPKQPVEPKESGHAPPDRAVLRERKEAAQRVEELKLKLMVLVDRHFEQSLSILKRWIQADEDKAQKKR